MNNPSKMPAKLVILFSCLSLLCLVILHFVSPEFEPNWRMVSEYALGNYKYMVTLFFIFWGLSSMLLSVTLWKTVKKIPAKIGTILLFISGIGAALASYYDVSQTEGHGFAGLLGIPTVPIAALLISYHLVKKETWRQNRKPILLLAHGTWISLVLMVVAMIVMISGFQKAGIEMGPDAKVPESVPAGVIALVGYVNRLLILVDLFWLIVISQTSLKAR